MKRTKKLVVLLLAILSCVGLTFGAFSSVSAAQGDKYYDWDGKELAWSFDANGISEQIPFQSGGNTQFFTCGDWPALGSDAQKLSYLNARYYNAANKFYGIVDPINDYRAEADGSYIVMKTPHEGGIFQSDNRYNARTMYIDLTEGLTYNKPINIRFSVDPDPEWAATQGQNRYIFFSLYDNLNDLMDYSHPHNFWFENETAMNNHPAKVVAGLGTSEVENAAAQNKFFSTKNANFADKTYEFVQTEHVLTFYIGSKLFDGTGGDYSFVAVDGEEVGGLAVTRDDFKSERVYVALGSQGRGTQLKINLSQSEKSWNKVTYASTAPGFSKALTNKRPGATFAAPTDYPTISGYTFDGWYTDEACTVKYVPAQLYSDLTLYAKYLNNSKTYDTVTIKSTTGGFDDVKLKLEHNSNFPVLGDVFHSNKFTPVYKTESGAAVTTSTKVTGNMTIFADLVEDKFEIYYRLNDNAPMMNSKYAYEKDGNGWDIAYTMYKDEANGSYNNTYYVTEDNKVIINQYYGSSSRFDPDTHEEMTLATVGSITNLNKLDLSKEINFKYSVRNFDIEKGYNPASGKIVFRLYDNVYDAITAGHKNNSNAKVAIQTNTVSGKLYFGAFYSIFDKVASPSYGWQAGQEYVLTMFIGETAGSSYLKVNGEKVSGALANVTREDFEGGYAYFQIGNEGSSHEYKCLLSQKYAFTKGAVQNGTYTADVAEGQVEFKTAINLTFSPNNGYGVSSIKLVAKDGTERDFTDELDANGKATIYKGWGDEELVVKFSKACVVTFNTNGGSSVPSQNVLAGGKAVRPSQPTKAGYSFRGWFDNPECTGSQFNFNTPITEDTTLYVKWLASGSTVNPGGGDSGSGDNGNNGNNGNTNQGGSSGIGCMASISGALLPSVVAMVVAGATVAIKRKKK